MPLLYTTIKRTTSADNTVPTPFLTLPYLTVASEYSTKLCRYFTIPLLNIAGLYCSVPNLCHSFRNFTLLCDTIASQHITKHHLAKPLLYIDLPYRCINTQNAISPYFTFAQKFSFIRQTELFQFCLNLFVFIIAHYWTLFLVTVPLQYHTVLHATFA